MNAQEIRERWSKATPGPWEHTSFLSGTESILIRVGPNRIPKDNPYEDNRGFIAANVYCHDIRGFNNTEDQIQQEKRDNAAAIASAPTDIAFLLAEVERLNRMVDKACERLELLSADDNYGYGKETWRKYLESEVADK